ncbi:ubiquitin carboxyl-terminal hydrolase 47 [Prorops nasuta]|uniref:ubiquitin carboxyl-terminal hydrolase 47 n=1 Tax=Prorops nasuta TaxID=863751 RepID=UPI0034CEAB11
MSEVDADVSLNSVRNKAKKREQCWGDSMQSEQKTGELNECNQIENRKRSDGTQFYPKNLGGTGFDYNPPSTEGHGPVFFTTDRYYHILDKNHEKPEIGYVGLVNQAMTCYLNSLLQALFMTPEFRNALYNWEYVEGSEKDEANSIPYQLQKLFLNLQTSSKPAVETTALTKSFGWDSTEAWQQHDIQELCRVMFDALEQKFKNTQQADLINRLYEGTMIDYVKCLECGTVKSREDTFLDIPLPLRPFGSTVAYNSVELAMNAFVQPETLEGNNQYHCEKCNKKCNAHKGLRFSKFPYLLTLHLKRFDFDYNTFHRIKLNDKVTFPDVLNLNSFIIPANQESPQSEEDIGFRLKCDESSTTDSGTLDDDCPPCDSSLTNSNHSTNHDPDDDEGIDICNGPSTSNGSTLHLENHENEKDQGQDEQGPYIYELFSIMIHSGSASGGHYYAYIKDFRTQDWLCFNDQSVSEITHDDIQKSYGGGPTRAYFSGAYSTSTNAYMLMYRQIDPARNALPMQSQDFPPHIHELLKKIKETEDFDRTRKKHIKLPKMEAFCFHPVEEKLVFVKLYALSNETLAEATEDFYKKFNLEDVVSLDQCRLVNFRYKQNLIDCSYDGMEDEMACSIAENVDHFLLEIRRKNKSFEVYPADGIVNRVFVVDVPKREIVNGPLIVRGTLSQTVKEYKEMLGQIINMDPKQMKLVLLRYLLLTKVIECNENTVESELFHGNNLFVSTMYDTDANKPPQESTLFQIANSFSNVTLCYVKLPVVYKEILEELNIPSLEENCKDSERPIKNSPSKLCMNESHKEAPFKFSLLQANQNNVTSNKESKGDEDAPGRNLSPQLGEGDEWNTPEQSNSEDSSSLNDSDKTLVGDAPEDEDFLTFLLSSPSENSRVKVSHKIVVEDWDVWDDDSELYFHAAPCSDLNQRLCVVMVDKKMRLSTFKKKLEPLVGVPMDYFKVLKNSSLVYYEADEIECTNLTEKLDFDKGTKITIKLGRALRSGEFKVKLYQLLFEFSEPRISFLCDWILSEGKNVGEAKKEILDELKRKYNVDIPHEMCRLMRKSGKTPSKVFLDDQEFEESVFDFSYEMIIQKLRNKEVISTDFDMLIFVRRWCPAEMSLSKFQEIALDFSSKDTLKKKLTQLSGIPEEFLEVAKTKGSFPCVMSVFTIRDELSWVNAEEFMQANSSWLEDGSVILYRDKREKPMELSEEEEKKILFKECSRMSGLVQVSSTSNYSPRRERALKIHLDTE